MALHFGGSGQFGSGYTAGSIMFSDGTAITQDNANLFWDDADNHVRLKGLATTALVPGGAGEARLGSAATTGLTISGWGSTNDVSVKNRAGTTVICVRGNTNRVGLGPGAATGDDGSGAIQTDGNWSRKIRTVTANATISATADSVVFVDATSGNVTLTMPAANAFNSNSAGRSGCIRIKRIDSSGNTVTIQRSGSDTIEGGMSVTLTALAAKDFECNASNAWWVC